MGKIRQDDVLDALKTYHELTGDPATLIWEDAGTVRFYRMRGKLTFSVIGAAAAHLAIVSYCKGWVDSEARIATPCEFKPERSLSLGDKPPVQPPNDGHHWFD